MKRAACVAFFAGIAAFAAGQGVPRMPVVPANPSPSYEFLGKLIEGQSYAYGPSIIHENGVFHMFYCSQPLFTPYGDWDHIRYSHSVDGRSWSTPQVVLTVSNAHTERAACDPSVVYFDAGDGPNYYLFYSGNKENVQTVMFVARAATIDGPYQKLTEQGTWEINPPDPKIIIYPKHASPDPPVQWYGAGQQTVVALNGVLYAWYYDDTEDYPTEEKPDRIFFTSTTDPTNWPTGVATNAETLSVDVKYDPAAYRFVMLDIANEHRPESYLSKRFSQDGVNWTAPEVVCDTGCFPNWANNVGWSGDRQGHVIAEPALVVYGAPKDLNPAYDNDCSISPPPYCWGFWDLYGSLGLGPRPLHFISR